MTQPYIQGPDPVEAAGFGTDSQEKLISKKSKPGSIMPYSTIDTFVSPDKLPPETLGQLPTYNPRSLDEAADHFRSNYIAKMAEYTGRTSISDLANKVLDFDRSELSRLVSGYDFGDMPLKDYLSALQENKPDTKAKYERDIASSIFDPIVRRVFREAVAEGYFGLKENTDRFKDIYVNSIAEDMGIKYAALVLDVSEKTVRNRMESYKADPRNNLRFPDDCKLQDLEGITERSEAQKRELSATSRQAREEERLWEQQAAVRQAQH
jgi:hypothetical protein